MNIAMDIGKRSTCIRPDRKIGAVVVSKGKEIVATGYNGNPRKMRHCSEIGCVREKEKVPSGERLELCTGVHAEMNALIQAGKSSKGATIYTTLVPCVVCSALIINAGIERVVYAKDYPDKRGLEILSTCGVTVERIEE